VKQKRLKSNALSMLKGKAARLKDQQEQAEDASCLPILQQKDIQAKKPDYFQHDALGLVDEYEMPLNGLAYVDAYFSLEGLKEEYYPLIPFFCYVLNKIGTARSGYLELVKRIDSYTGGIDFFPLCVPAGKEKQPDFVRIGLSAKFLEENAKSCLEIVKELLSEYAFLEPDRLSFYLKEQQSDMEMNLVESPQSFALSLAASGFSRSAYLNELWSGKSQLLWLKENAQKTDEKSLEALRQNLLKIAAFVFMKDNAKGVVIAGKKRLKAVVGQLNGILKELPSKTKVIVPNRKQAINKLMKGLGITTQVSSTVFVRTVPKIGSKETAGLFVLSKFLQSEYLHKEIREKGGAYGAYCRYDYLSGFFSFLSYRDPHIRSTIKTYLGAKEFISTFSFSENNIKEAVLMALSEIDRPVSPRVEAERHFLWEQIGLKAGWREKLRQEILLINANDLKKMAEKYLTSGVDDYSVVVVSAEEKLKGVLGIEIERL